MEGNSLIIHGQYIKDLSFENPKIPGTFSVQKDPHFNISIDIISNKIDKNVFEVVLTFSVASTINDNQPLFQISLDYAGLFTINIEDKNELEKILLVQCPAILFPFARRIISDVSKDGGYPPVSLDPIDFLGLYIQKQQQNLAESVAN